MLRHTEPIHELSSLPTTAVPFTVAALNEPQIRQQALSTPYTAAEIARTIAEMERERSLKESVQNRTAQISDILEQLHLDLSPEEVAERIEQKRLAGLREYMLRQNTLRRRRLLFAGIGGVLSCAGLVSFLWLRSYAPAPVETTTQPAVAAVEYAKRLPDQEVRAVDSAGQTVVEATR